MKTRFRVGVLLATCLFALIACSKDGDTVGFATPEEAEEAFYDAFAKGDVNAMMAVWEDDPEIACIHPMGDQISGPDMIRDGWQGIFENLPAIRFEISEVQSQQDDRVAIRTLRERMVLLDGHRPQRPVVTTNVYRLTNSGWRMIHHHASPIVTQRKPGQ